MPESQTPKRPKNPLQKVVVFDQANLDAIQAEADTERRTFGIQMNIILERAFRQAALSAPVSAYARTDSGSSGL